jgi:hypothetical protein
VCQFQDKGEVMNLALKKEAELLVILIRNIRIKQSGYLRPVEDKAINTN